MERSSKVWSCVAYNILARRNKCSQLIQNQNVAGNDHLAAEIAVVSMTAVFT